MKPFNFDEYLKTSRKVVTRDGRDVRIICKDRLSGVGPIVALVNESGEENIVSYDINGKFHKHSDSELDLFFAPDKHEGWVNVYKGEDGLYYSGDLVSTKERALKIAEGYNCVATIKIEWEE